jgi:hypothetical protein
MAALGAMQREYYGAKVGLCPSSGERRPTSALHYGSLLKAVGIISVTVRLFALRSK